MFIITSNYTQIATADTLKEAKTLAQIESHKYDDVLVIQENGTARFMLQYGAIYKLTRSK